MKHASIKVVVADDHPIVLHGLTSLLREDPGFEVVAACDDGVTAFEAVVHHAPDIALLDMRLPKMTGLQILKKVSSENLKTRVVILTAFTDDHDVLTAISHGVSGIIMKDSLVSTLIGCLRRVSMGDRCVPAELVRKELDRVAEAASIGHALTLREREVMCLVARGMSNKVLARALQISEGTLKLHLHHIYCKTGVNSRSALLTLVLGLGDALNSDTSRTDRH